MVSYSSLRTISRYDTLYFTKNTIVCDYWRYGNCCQSKFQSCWYLINFTPFKKREFTYFRCISLPVTFAKRPLVLSKPVWLAEKKMSVHLGKFDSHEYLTASIRL